MRGAISLAERLSASFDVIAHELRTPLNSVLGWLTLLKSDKLQPERARHAIDIIERNCKAQARLVEDLLDISRLASGSVRIERSLVQLSSVVERALESLRADAESKRMTIEVELGAVDARVRGDARRLQQVLQKLLSNAIKFTPEGGHVSISSATEQGFVELRVADSGEGIPAQQLADVFEPFYQLDSSASRRHEGLGLGLAIVRYVVELHGGSVEAASAGVGHGTTITVRLPLATA